VAVNARVGLHPQLTIDAGTMRDRVASGKRGGQLIFVAGSDRVKRGVRQAPDLVVAAIETASDEHDVMTVDREQTCQVPADESRSSGDGDSHGFPLAALKGCATPKFLHVRLAALSAALEPFLPRRGAAPSFSATSRCASA